jgi:2-oxoglutarate dehydrogenase E1 component
MGRDRLSYTTIANADYIEEQHRRYLENPESVDLSWRRFFEGVHFASEVGFESAGGDDRVYNLIHAYRLYGHLLARVNPIDPHPALEVAELVLERLGFKQEELQHNFPTCGLLPQESAPLHEIIDRLREIYCRNIGIEYMDMRNQEMEQWIQEKIEPTLFRPELTIDEKRQILEFLNQSELFEIFLHTKYVGQKRFSIEGGETLIPMMNALIERGAKSGVKEFTIGMAHRGRLNVLCNILKKSYAHLFHEFEGTAPPVSFEGSGDVKYHKGYSADIETREGEKVHLCLTANPSHLEAVNTVVQGRARAKQILKDDDVEKRRVIPILIHGDSAISGQGVVYEGFQLSRLPGYGVGGTIHIVINNQIGFTTLPKDSRSTYYCTDIAKAFSAPVFHVNGEDPEGCVYACLLAMELRQMIHCDVVIELNCYRKYGHNEGDEPAFTQPVEYQLIRKKSSVREIYRDQLIQQGVLEREMAEQLEAEFRQELQAELDRLDQFKTAPAKNGKSADWDEIQKATPALLFEPAATAVDSKIIREVTAAFCKVPEGFHIHRKVERLAKERLEAVSGDPAAKTIDWGLAEHLAFGTLLWEGWHVRLSGQDSRRGTFSHRHALWVDQIDARKYFPLSNLKKGQGRFDVFNSPLSEYGVLGFEFGYSLSYPKALVMWEAQFGDFANGAQIIIDQFLCSGEEKWGRFSGLTLLLPHGYEGQGPEHSSGRIERFLQLAGGDNIQVVNPTTPAQLFHLLRRQVVRPIRKPLIIFTPKANLRHQLCVSSVDELSRGTFREVLDDPQPPKKARQLAFCSGKVFYDLLEEREKRKVGDVAIVRIEQFYPFDQQGVAEMAKRYSGAERVCWVQEEPSNMGGWEFLRPRLAELLPKGIELTYIGRERSASPATGSAKKHHAEVAQFMDQLFGRA